MILTIDVGNSNICLALHDGKAKPLFMERIYTDREKTQEAYEKDVESVFSLHSVPMQRIEGIVFSSVVAPVTKTLLPAVDRLFSCPIITVNYDLDLGFKSFAEDPYTIGSDILADGVGALNEYPLPLVTFDFGTATVASYFNEKGEHEGVFISPGVRTSLNTLSSTSSALPDITLEAPGPAIGRTTVSAVKSGILYGFAGHIDGIAAHVEEMAGKEVTVVLTGGLSPFIAPYCKHPVIQDSELLMKGLYHIFVRNHDKI